MKKAINITGNRYLKRHAMTMEFTGEWMCMRLFGAIVSVATLMVIAVALVINLR